MLQIIVSLTCLVFMSISSYAMESQVEVAVGGKAENPVVYFSPKGLTESTFGGIIGPSGLPMTEDLFDVTQGWTPQAVYVCQSKYYRMPVVSGSVYAIYSLHNCGRK